MFRISHAAVFMLVLAVAFDLIDGDIFLLFQVLSSMWVARLLF